MTRFRMMLMGCRTMPHVGEHPGTEVLLALIVLGGVAGSNGGWVGVVGGAVLMALVMGPLYLAGAYSRAKISLRLSRDSDAMLARKAEGFEPRSGGSAGRNGIAQIPEQYP